LIVGEPESLSAELFLKDSILLAQVLNRRLLMLVDPASENRDEELPWLEDPGHPGILRPIPVPARLLPGAAGGYNQRLFGLDRVSVHYGLNSVNH
jgi:hypothetical protein